PTVRPSRWARSRRRGTERSCRRRPRRRRRAPRPVHGLSGSWRASRERGLRDVPPPGGMRASVTGPQPRPDRVIEARRERKRRDLNPRSFSGRSLSRRVQSAALPRFPAARVAGAVQIDPSGVVWWDHATRAGEATMRFDENAQLDTSNIDDLRGSGGGGGGGLGGRVAVGGGGLGIIGLILYFLLSALGGGGSFDGGGAL